MQPEDAHSFIEQEITLAVTAPDPVMVCDNIASLTRLGAFSIANREPRNIRDTYWDTPDRELSAIGWALRLREQGHNRLLALKGPSRPGSHGLTAREETEGPWTPDLMKHIREALQHNGIVSKPDLAPCPIQSPEHALADMGLRTIQERFTSRKVRIIADTPSSQRAFAHMVLDRVTYILGHGPVLHYEIEVEALNGERAEENAEQAVNHLAHMFPGQLLQWEPSKLATGLALQELDRQGRLFGLLVDGRLTAEAYEAIAALLAVPSR